MTHCFNHVSFSYKHGGDGEETLHDIDLHIASGETIGIIGGNRMWKIQSGEPDQSSV